MSEDLFQISALVPDFEHYAQTYESLSAATRARWTVTRDISYGPSARQVVDVIHDGKPATGRPVHMFIHGGYWRAGSKDAYAFVAEPVIAAGGVAVLVEYDLLPQIRMADLVAQIRAALVWVAGNARDFGGDPDRITVSGHSAGGHLASWLAARLADEPMSAPPPKGLLLLSGIFDLAPIRHSFLQPELALTRQEATDWSPLTASPLPGCVRLVAFGNDETQPFHDQALAYVEHLGEGAQLLNVADRNHMSVILELGNPRHPLGQALMAMVAAE